MSTRSPGFGLGFHLDGQICRVGCSFCYLGARAANGAGERVLDEAVLAGIVSRLVSHHGATPFRELAVAVSEPARRWRPGLRALAGAAAAAGVPLTVTTTPAVVADDPWVLDGAFRVSLSLDPEKTKGEAPVVAGLGKAAAGIDLAVLERALAETGPRGTEVVALVSLASPEVAAALAEGLLAELLEHPGVAAVALNGLKPPPPWCDRAFWLRFCKAIAPLLERHLHRRLHLDCYVGARILGLGGCPAKPDVSPGREFRACVYQAAPDFVFGDADELARRVAGYVPPDVCPFTIR